jgi:hypothetical protein
MLQAPVPFLLGIHEELLNSVIPDPTSPLVTVNLDIGKISHEPKFKFPEHEVLKLCKSLRQLLKPEAYYSNLLYAGKTPAMMNDEELSRRIRELFVTFFANIVGSIEEFLEKPKQAIIEKSEDDEEITLNEEKYIKSRPESQRDFISKFVKTLSFLDFKH